MGFRSGRSASDKPASRLLLFPAVIGRGGRLFAKPKSCSLLSKVTAQCVSCPSNLAQNRPVLNPGMLRAVLGVGTRSEAAKRASGVGVGGPLLLTYAANNPA
jgi:hypothetical protein